jgi:hypothetical protein
VAYVNLNCCSPYNPDRKRTFRFYPDELVEFLGGNPDRKKQDLNLTNNRIEITESQKFFEDKDLPDEIKNPPKSRRQ